MWLINAFGTSFYRIMLNIKRIYRVTNVSLYTCITSIKQQNLFRESELANLNSWSTFFACLLRNPVGRDREYALYVPKYGQRKPRRQRTLFLRYTQCLLGNLTEMLDQRQLLAVSYNGPGPLQLKKACSRLLRSLTIMMMIAISTNFYRATHNNYSQIVIHAMGAQNTAKVLSNIHDPLFQRQ